MSSITMTIKVLNPMIRAIPLQVTLISKKQFEFLSFQFHKHIIHMIKNLLLKKIYIYKVHFLKDFPSLRGHVSDLIVFGTIV